MTKELCEFQRYRVGFAQAPGSPSPRPTMLHKGLPQGTCGGSHKSNIGVPGPGVGSFRRACSQVAWVKEEAEMQSRLGMGVGEQGEASFRGVALVRKSPEQPGNWSGDCWHGCLWIPRVPDVSGEFFLHPYLSVIHPVTRLLSRNQLGIVSECKVLQSPTPAATARQDRRNGNRLPQW